MGKLFSAFSGRTTFFAAFFAFVGSTLQFLHMLNSTYIQFVAVIMGYVVVHSAKQDVVTHFATGADTSTETTVSTKEASHTP